MFALCSNELKGIFSAHELVFVALSAVDISSNMSDSVHSQIVQLYFFLILI